MASLSYHHLSFCTNYKTTEKGPNKESHKCVKINGTNSFSQVGLLSQDQTETVHLEQQIQRLNIPRKRQYVDPYRQGIITEEEAKDGVFYRQTIVVRSCEVGPDRTATIESILNLLQETALNHVWMSGLLGDGFGATHGMMRNNLIWVVSRLRVQVDHYPIWGEVIEIDTWVGASGKNGMRRDWLLRSKATGIVFARGTSTWVMMNKQTRRLSKMPDEVRAEISPWFIEKLAIEEDSPEKIQKLDNNVRYMRSNLRPSRSDLDMNNHVNNVKYVRWMLETIPDEFLESHQLSDITLEYRRECGSSDVVQSLSEPQESGLTEAGIQQCNDTVLNEQCSLLCSEIFEGNGWLGSLNQFLFSYTHLLQTKGEKKNEEIVRGKTTWKKKHSDKPFSIPP